MKSSTFLFEPCYVELLSYGVNRLIVYDQGLYIYIVYVRVRYITFNLFLPFMVYKGDENTY